MRKARGRKVIEREFYDTYDNTGEETPKSNRLRLILEVLLDIRALLNRRNNVGKN